MVNHSVYSLLTTVWGRSQNASTAGCLPPSNVFPSAFFRAMSQLQKNSHMPRAHRCGGGIHRGWVRVPEGGRGEGCGATRAGPSGLCRQSNSRDPVQCHATLPVRPSMSFRKFRAPSTDHNVVTMHCRWSGQCGGPVRLASSSAVRACVTTSPSLDQYAS